MDVAGEGAAREQAPTPTRALLWTVDCGCSAYHSMPPCCEPQGSQGHRRFGVLATAGRWMDGGSRWFEDVKVAGRWSPQMSLTKLKRRPPEARDP
jgi:hypothetical protein